MNLQLCNIYFPGGVMFSNRRLTQYYWYLCLLLIIITNLTTDSTQLILLKNLTSYGKRFYFFY